MALSWEASSLKRRAVIAREMSRAGGLSIMPCSAPSVSVNRTMNRPQSGSSWARRTKRRKPVASRAAASSISAMVASVRATISPDRPAATSAKSVSGSSMLL